MPFDRLAVLAQYLLPKQALTALAGRIASPRGGLVTQRLIRWYIAHYGVDMSQAAEPGIGRYATFNEFFTRALRSGARPLADADLLCPIDGEISQFGAIAGDQIFQAKGHRYSTTALLGGDAVLARQFENGSFATLYLSPKDYHRVHMPCEGRLRRMVHVPGALFSVNPTTARGVPGLFARNERVVCAFDSVHGPFVLVLVGATIVGSIATVWHGPVNAPRVARVRDWHYFDGRVTLQRGEEMGRFSLGSTVVLLFPPAALRFDEAWRPQAMVCQGEAMANWDRSAVYENPTTACGT